MLHKKITDLCFTPLRNVGMSKFFMMTLPVFIGLVLLFVNPAKLDGGDFMAIAWNPGQELLAKGALDVAYPYPLWTVVVMIPFVIWPPQVGILLWFTCNLVMLAASLAILIPLFDWKVSPFTLFVIVALTLYFPPVLYGLWYGQLTIFALLMFALTVHFFLREQWTGLGIVLGLSFIKPHVMILLAGLLLLLSLWHRRWQTLFAFGAIILTLILISLPFISSPAQIVGGGISSHLSTYVKLSSTLWGLCLSLGVSWIVPLFIALGLTAWVGWLWFPFLRSGEIPERRVLFLFSAAVIINLIIIPYGWLYNLCLLLLPLGYSISLALKAKKRQQLIWLAALFMIMHPLMLFLLVINQARHSYEIISVLALFVIMTVLEYQMTGAKLMAVFSDAGLLSEIET